MHRSTRCIGAASVRWSKAGSPQQLETSRSPARVFASDARAASARLAHTSRVRLLLMAFLGCGLLAVLAGCGDGGPTLAARSDRQGTLTIKGSHWHSCGS